ncbi:MAG: nucleoside-triphosphatase [Candidatus Izemoplasmatales bacterium]|nr:nucleoside-triphosphatase [Candidatus Izemoplasmatales bacterium]
MINIISGCIDSGKTSKMMALYQFYKTGDGFVATKQIENKIVKSYWATRLTTMEERPFIYHNTYVPNDFDSCCQVGPYMVSSATLTWIEETIREMITKKISPIYLDEIGLLELDGKGFHAIFSEMVASKLEIYVAIRNELIDAVLKKYAISEYQLM